jgi:nitroreductase
MVRSFSGAPPEPAALQRILGLALGAPSAGNSQGWEAVVLEGDEQTGQFWDATTTSDWRRTSRRWPQLCRAPVVVVLFSHPGAYLARYSEPDKAGSGLGNGTEAWPIPYWDVDAGMAVLLLLLGAVSEGLGACFLGNFRGEAKLRRSLEVPDDRRYVGAVLIGLPGGDELPGASAGRPKRTMAEVFHRGRW